MVEQWETWKYVNTIELTSWFHTEIGVFLDRQKDVEGFLFFSTVGWVGSWFVKASGSAPRVGGRS